MKSTREVFGEILVECGEINPNLLILSTDLSESTKTVEFKNKFPDRFVECDIAGQNIIEIASGLSEYGYRVFLTSFGSFLTGRYDQIRCSLAYSGANVVLVGTHAGLAIEKDGVTQMGLEDINILRSLPNIHIYQPATPRETDQIVKYLAESNEFAYLRLGRQSVYEFFGRRYEFTPGRIVHIYPFTNPLNAEIIIFSSGCLLGTAIEVADRLESHHSAVYNVPTLKPLDPRIILDTITPRAKLIVTIEDHSIIGGLGSIISEILSSKSNSPKLLRIGIEDWPEGGNPDDLYEKYGMTTKSILKKIENILHDEN